LELTPDKHSLDLFEGDNVLSREWTEAQRMAKRKHKRATKRLKDGRMPWEPKQATLERREQQFQIDSEAKASLCKALSEVSIEQQDGEQIATAEVEIGGKPFTLKVLAASSTQEMKYSPEFGVSIAEYRRMSFAPFTLERDNISGVGILLHSMRLALLRAVFPFPQPDFPDRLEPAVTEWARASVAAEKPNSLRCMFLRMLQEQAKSTQ